MAALDAAVEDSAVGEGAVIVHEHHVGRRRARARPFRDVDDGEARLAYLVATAAAAWVEAHTDRDSRARLLGRLGEGWSDDEALSEAVGMGTDGIDAALRAEILSEFPPGL